MNRNNLRITALILISTMLLLSCAGSAEPAPLEIRLAAQDIQWGNENIDAVVGQTITITVNNEGVLPHNLKIEAMGVDVNLSPGATEVITFVVDQAGTLEFYCDEPGHREAGMTGTITVTE